MNIGVQRAPADPRQHSQYPIVTGTSVLGIKYKDGVMIAADCLGSYGSLARFRSVSRMFKMNDQVVIAASGDYADFQHIKQMLFELQVDNDNLHDSHKITPQATFSFLTRVLYNRRSNFNPLWNQLVVAGVNDKGEPTLGYIDKVGTAFETNTMGTGYGAYMALPILRKQHEDNPNMTEEEARKALEDCMRVMYYRDARSLNKMEIAKITLNGVTISEPYSLETNWNIANAVAGYN